MKKRLILFVVILLVFTGISLFAFTYLPRAGTTITLTELLGQAGRQLSNEQDGETKTIGNPTFLSSPDAFLDATLEINLETLFTAPVVFQQNISAPNILYSLEAGNGIELTGDPQSPTITNTGVLSLEGIAGAIELTGNNITISTSGNRINFSAQLPDVTYPDGEIVGTTDTQLLSNKTVTDLVFDAIPTPVEAAGKVYFDEATEKLFVYTDGYGWLDLTFGSTPGSFGFTTDGEGIELVGTEFQLELNGTSLSKSAAGLKISNTYAGQGSITTVGAITSGSWNASEIADLYISDALTISALGSVDDAALSANVSLLGQSIDTLEIEDQTILPQDMNTNGGAPADGYILTYNGATTVFEWLSPTTVFGSEWSRSGLGVLTPATANDTVSITSSNTPMTLTNTGTGLSFIVNDSAGDTSPFVIDANGNVGIGTSAPGEALDVRGAIAVNGARALYVPDQSSFSGTLIVGSGGSALSHTFSTQGQENTFVGMGAGNSVTTGYSNTYIGADAGMTSTTGYHNTFVGQFAGLSNNSFSNTLIGRAAGAASTTGQKNVMIGDSAGGRNVGGSNSLILGTEADYNNVGGANNVLLGFQAGMGAVSHNKSRNIFIGYQAGFTEYGSDKLYIENSNSTSPLIWGDFQTDIVGINGRFGVGTVAPSARADMFATTTQLRLSYSLAQYVDFYSNSTGELGISPSGTNVGIGTTNPSYTLDVVGTARLSGDLRLQGALYDAGGSSGALGNLLMSTGVGTTWTTASSLLDSSYFKNLGNGFGAAAEIGTTDAYSLSLITGGNANIFIDTTGDIGIGGTAPELAPSLFVTASGEVGIGTTAPGSKLSIDSLGSGAGTTMVIDSSGNVWKDSSSRRYKTNIKPLQADFKKILDLSPVSYDFIANGIHTIGYIAEEVDAAGLTDLVIYNTAGQPDAIKYDRFAIYLAEIVKDQQRAISHLQSITMELDTEGSVQASLPSTDELPVTEPEIDSSEHASKTDVTALKDRIEQVISPEIASIKETLNTISTTTDSFVASSSAQQIAQEQTIASLSARLDALSQDVLGIRSDALSASVSAAIAPESLVVEDLTAIGKTNLYDVGVTGEFIAGLIAIDGVGASINSLGEPLRLQSDKMADVEFMGGLVKVTTEGNLLVDGEVSAQKYLINTIDGTQASAGEATIPAGSSEILIQTESVTDGSLIYVTFTSDYSPATRYWIEDRNNEESFTLKTDDPVKSPSKFSWWIVN